MHINDLLWIAGVLEGDGHFGVSLGGYPRISLVMVDEDTIKKYADLVQINYSKINYKEENWRDVYKAEIGGFKAYKLMKIFMPYMGKRRSSQIKEAIQKYEQRDKAYYFDVNTHISNVLRDKNDANMSVLNLAKKYNVAPSTIKKWLRNNEVPQKTISISIEKIEQADMTYWLAGILEAEGSFVKPSPSAPNRSKITLTMTDEDVVAKIADLLNCNYMTWQDEKHKNKQGELYKRQYLISYRGKRAIKVMNVLFPLMSERRKSQIESAIKAYNTDYAKNTHMSYEIFDHKETLKMKELKDKGASLRNIAEEFNTTHRTVRNMIKKLETRTKEEWSVQEKRITRKFKRPI